LSKSAAVGSDRAPKHVLDGHGIQRRAMAGQGVPLSRIIRNALQMYHKHRRYTDREVEIYRDRCGLVVELLRQSAGRSVRGAAVLEVGCGQRAVMPLLLAALGAEVSAVDVELPTYQMNALSLLKIVRNNGLHRAVKSVVRHALFDRRFYKGLEDACGVVFHPFPAMDLKVMDVARHELPKDRFDMVFSFNVLEHIVDVESAVRNMNSALKPDGIGHVVVHLFPSLSGGHCLDWQYALDQGYPEWGIPANVPPWDHLRENRYPADSYLNELRLSEYRRIFHEETQVTAEECTREGVELLSLAPRELLEEYGPEDLTTVLASFTFRKKQGACSDPQHLTVAVASRGSRNIVTGPE
jgi:SAM-dependent methyltransferase